MPEQIDAALAELRAMLLDQERLVRAVAAGRRHGTQPQWRRAELRPVALKDGPRLQVSVYDESRPYTRNLSWTGDAPATVDELLGEPFGNWHVTTTEQVVQVRVTKRGAAQVHRDAVSPGGAGPSGPAGAAPAHDRAKAHLLDPGDPLYDVIGGNAAKRRQVDAFLRALDASLGDELPDPLRVVDLGCGNAYLSFAAYRYLTTGRGLRVELTGVDVRPDQRERNAALAGKLDWSDRVRFVAGTIAEAPVDAADLVLALHACDTATDDALARAVGWRAPYVLAAPCCHHDVAAQLRRSTPPRPYSMLTRHGILRERYADVLTDALRAAVLRLVGYRVDVVEFVDSAHTPRNLLLRARRTGAAPTAELVSEYRELVDGWAISPRLGELLAAELPGAARA